MVEYGHHARNDRWAIEAVFPQKRGGFFVEAGACAGLQGSASYVLEREFEWQGICVEPIESYYKILSERRACLKDSRCLSGKTGDVVEFLSFPDDPPRSGILSLNKNTVSQWPTKPSWVDESHAAGVTTMKETVTFSDLLEQHSAPAEIDYVCLDVEGAELTILEPYDFANDRRILSISVEGDTCDEMFAARGYRRVTNPFASEQIDHYFVHASLSEQVRDLWVD